jgi:hypothetical protein
VRRIICAGGCLGKLLLGGQGRASFDVGRRQMRMTPAGTMTSVPVSNGFIGRYSGLRSEATGRRTICALEVPLPLSGELFLIGLGIAPST